MLLVRDPRDAIVSFFYHSKNRKFAPGTTLDQCVRDKEWGLSRLINFYNLMAEYQRFSETALFFKYEDLKGAENYNLPCWFKMFAHLLDEDIDEAALTWALDINVFEKMKTREKTLKDRRQSSNPPEKKRTRVRSGKIGSYQDKMESETIEFCEDYINENLDDVFSYYKTG